MSKVATHLKRFRFVLYAAGTLPLARLDVFHGAPLASLVVLIAMGGLLAVLLRLDWRQIRLTWLVVGLFHYADWWAGFGLFTPVHTNLPTPAEMGVVYSLIRTGLIASLCVFPAALWRLVKAVLRSSADGSNSRNAEVGHTARRYSVTAMIVYCGGMILLSQGAMVMGLSSAPPMLAAAIGLPLAVIAASSRRDSIVIVVILTALLGLDAVMAASVLVRRDLGPPSSWGLLLASLAGPVVVIRGAVEGLQQRLRYLWLRDGGAPSAAQQAAAPVAVNLYVAAMLALFIGTVLYVSFTSHWAAVGITGLRQADRLYMLLIPAVIADAPIIGACSSDVRYTSFARPNTGHKGPAAAVVYETTQSKMQLARGYDTYFARHGCAPGAPSAEETDGYWKICSRAPWAAFHLRLTPRSACRTLTVTVHGDFRALTRPGKDQP